MKKRIQKRLEEIEKMKSPTKTTRPDELLKYEIEKLNAYADAVKNNDFGFVSRFKGDHANLYRGHDRVFLSYKDVDKKVKKIKEEYSLALDIAPTISNIINIANNMELDPKLLNKFGNVDTIIDKCLNGCLEKGYNIPAILILKTLCPENCKDDSKLITLKSNDEISMTIKKIASNYALKELYEDNASYLASDTTLFDKYAETKKDKMNVKLIILTKISKWVSLVRFLQMKISLKRFLTIMNMC